MSLEVQGARDLSPLETEVVYSVFKESVLASELQLEVVNSLGLGGRGATDPEAGLKEVLLGEIKQLPAKSTSDYDGNGKITISKSAFPHTQALNERSTHYSLGNGGHTDLFRPGNMHYLSALIHECAHHWQGKYNRHTDSRLGRGAYDFTERQLIKENVPDFSSEQHASAAQVYFVIAWQLRHRPWPRPITAETRGPNVDLTSKPLDSDRSVGPVHHYDRISSIPHTNGRRIVSNLAAKGMRNTFHEYLRELWDGGPRKPVVCEESTQRTRVTSRSGILWERESKEPS